MSSFDPLVDLADRPALEQLSRALWSRGTLRGAAVLVGAGVSRGGARLLSDDAPLPPLWFNLADDMAHELYGARSASAPRDPLRLAEEFRAGLGDAALADFLRRRIRDDALDPGQIHRDLLDLPWADVLTTNYDTLLERAARGAQRGYDLVLAESDLAHAVGPRIIKLHGSLRDGASVVLSEEDYRTYPQRRAAFVNTARQIFIENELCLLGFSGDDPNFLQWAGWVRDRLGGSARRIYLIGVLDLPPIKRRLLEARGIAPIDLAPAVKDERVDRRHAVAISLFLAHLKAARPAEPDDWKPAPQERYPSLYSVNHETWHRDIQDPEKIVGAFRAALAIWRADRQTCPGWVVCPHNIRLLIRYGTDTVDNLPLALDTLSEPERRDALLELAWRHDRGACPIQQWQADYMDAILQSETLTESDPELICALARVLLNSARVAEDEEAFASRITRLEALAASHNLSALIAHERCLHACDRLDFAFISNNAGKIDGDDPIWGLRRAALLYQIEETDDALRTISAASRRLRTRVLRDPDSVALRSRLAWMKLLADALRWEDKGALVADLEGLDRLVLRDYEPWEQLQTLGAQIDEGLRKRLETKPIEANFEAGSYSDNRNTINFSKAAQVTPLGELRHVAERAGLPIRMPYVNMLGTSLADALRLDFRPTATWHAALLSTKPSYSGGPIDVHFSRIAIARLDVSAVANLREWIERAVAFWCARVRKRANFSDHVDTLRLYVEALSRVAARDDTESAKAHVRLAVELGRDSGLNHWWLNEPIGHLLRRAIDAISPDKRSDLSAELIQFPLAVERSANDPSMSWYNPGPDAYRFIRRCGNETTFDARVSVFLHHLAIDGPSRPEAAVRLLHLHEKRQLTEDQIATFAEILWRGVARDGNSLPDKFRLFSHAFLIAPAPPDIEVFARVYSQLFGSERTAGPAHLLAAASGRPPALLPSEADAIRLFRNVAGWRPKKPDTDSLDEIFSRPLRVSDSRTMASILGIVAAPALARYDRTVERAEAALTFLDDTGLPEALSALPVFYGLDAAIDRRIESTFRRSLASVDHEAIPAAVNALDRWLRLSERNQASPLPDVLRDRALRAMERGRTSGLADIIYLVRRLIEADRCGDCELDRIVEALDELRTETDYGSPDGDAEVESERAVSLPIIRSECVRLARALETKGVTIEPIRIWHDVAACDPLPEVRNALRNLME